jgi:hypothetical protein
VKGTKRRRKMRRRRRRKRRRKGYSRKAMRMKKRGA